MAKPKNENADKRRGRPGPPPLSLAPLTVDEALEALLKTPPPTADEEKREEPKSVRKRKGKQ
jgi:hypothetical protein